MEELFVDQSHHLQLGRAKLSHFANACPLELELLELELELLLVEAPPTGFLFHFVIPYLWRVSASYLGLLEGQSPVWLNQPLRGRVRPWVCQQ